MWIIKSGENAEMIMQAALAIPTFEKRSTTENSFITMDIKCACMCVCT